MSRTIQSLLTRDKAALETSLPLDSSTAHIEVQMLLQHVLGVSRAWLLSHPEQVLDETQEADYRALLQRRLAGEPLAYILGEREFFGLSFKVTPATLIPRPETELLVELALERIPSPLPLSREREREERSGGRGAFRALDLGTGSGAIALAIAHARPDVEVTAVDASGEALEVAQENARRLLAQHEAVHTSTGSVRTDILIANVRLLRSDWFSALADERFDLIVSNPPYIAEGDVHLAQGDLRFEPRGALASGADGLDDIRRIVAQAKEHLNPGGWLLFEHGYDQAVRARELLEKAGYAGVFSARDLAGIERVSGGAIPDSSRPSTSSGRTDFSVSSFVSPFPFRHNSPCRSDPWESVSPASFHELRHRRRRNTRNRSGTRNHGDRRIWRASRSLINSRSEPLSPLPLAGEGWGEGILTTEGARV